MADTEDELREERMRARRPTRCVCGDDLPGRCPGVEFCPYSGYGEPDEDEEDEE